MELDPEIVQELLATFALELEEQLQSITDDLLRLEQGLAAEQRPQAYERIFRAAHNIKGAATGVGAELVAKLSHRLESLFSRLKREDIPPAPDLTDVCLTVMDGLRRIQEAWRPGEPFAPKIHALFDDLSERLDAVAREEEALEAPAPQTRNPTPTQPAPVVPVDSAPPAAATQPEAGVAAESVAAVSEDVRTDGAELVRVDMKRLKRVSALAEELEATRVEMHDHLEQLRRIDTRLGLLLRGWNKHAPVLERLAGVRGDAELEAFLHEVGLSLRELQKAGAHSHRAVRQNAQRFAQVSGQLQGQVRMLRMVRASGLLRPLVRSVRDMARDMGKNVRFDVQGDEIEMDRAVLDGIKDPLTHLLRNAIDHGVEDLKTRRARGKPDAGVISLSLQQVGGRIRVRLDDDGAGVDPEAIAEVAVRKGLIGASEIAQMSRADKLEIIFRPGFSSKSYVTDVSGRGVGLDVVRANIQGLKGSVRVESRTGQGSRFLLDLPLTLATDQGLVVRVAGQRYAIPTTAVERVVEVDPAELVNVEAGEAVLYEQRPYPISDLAVILEKPAADVTGWKRLPIVIVSHGWNAIALLVEEVVGDREIVVKRLNSPLRSVRNVSGATVTGSGEVMMVLNPGDLVRSALQRGGVSPGPLRRVQADEPQAAHILVVDDSITTRTLERNILEKHGFRVTVATHGRQAWEMLQDISVDLVISDVQMPLMDGIELTRTIKGDQRFKTLPVIIVSSLGDETDKRRGIEAGADGYLVKSQFETQALLTLVRQLV